MKLEKRQLDITEHLIELRGRILRSLIFICTGSVLGWIFYDRIFDLVSAPIMLFLDKGGSKFLLTGVTEGLMIKMQISIITGLIFALPIITLEGWGFLTPALTKQERKSVYVIAPLSVLLFISGVLIAYVILPTGIRWLISQNPPQAMFMPSVSQTLLFILKMYVAFGLVFQMPVILMFLGRIGIIDAGMLKRYWRHAIVAIGVTSAVVTPSSDAFSMLMMCIPMIGLYVLSIGLVKISSRKRIVVQEALDTI
ncbi:MAG: twin-arginine translocase subunit TatC [Armatimonadota bacterium]